MISIKLLISILPFHSLTRLIIYLLCQFPYSGHIQILTFHPLFKILYIFFHVCLFFSDTFDYLLFLCTHLYLSYYFSLFFYFTSLLSPFYFWFFSFIFLLLWSIFISILFLFSHILFSVSSCLFLFNFIFITKLGVSYLIL